MKWGLGRSLAMIALVVQAPRLILSILDADMIAIDKDTRQFLLIIAAIGTASILTGGQLYLIHVIGTTSKWRPGLVIIWLGVLTFSGAMIIPSVFGGLSSNLLPSVLSNEQKLWWSLIAAMSHELTAAGCVLASIAKDRDRRNGDGEGLSEDDLLLKVTTERNELEDKVRDLESDLEDKRDIKSRRTQQAKALDLDPERMEEARELFESGNIAGYQRILLKSLQDRADKAAAQSTPIPLMSNVAEAKETAARLASTFTPRVQDYIKGQEPTEESYPSGWIGWDLSTAMPQSDDAKEESITTKFEAALASLPDNEYIVYNRLPVIKQPTLQLQPDAVAAQPSPYPFPCLYCHQPITSPADVFNHSKCGITP